MNLNEYRFRSQWVLPAPHERVYDALEDLGSYPRWWREVKEAEQVSDEAFDLRCRATLPYDLYFTTTQSRRDREAGVLEARMTGDLDGFSRWSIQPSGTGTLAVFEEEVEATKRLLRVLAPVARPVFRLNHWLMMQHGQNGLRAYLDG
jgi:hypothetical protein